MNYGFPVILHLDDVRPAIEGRTDFIIAERDWGFVVNYLVAMPDTFPEIKTVNDTIRRECRGLMFDRDGKIMARRLHKFFNVNEREETQDRHIDLGKHHVILEKLDGSMITPIRVGDDLRFATKMGINEISMQAEVFVANHPAIYEFCKQMMDLQWTPIFEWCSRKQKIVIDYPEDRLVLIAVRDTVSGDYMHYEDMVLNVNGRFEVVRQFEGSIQNMNHLIEHTRDLEEAEGFIIRFDDGHMIKVKSDWYVTRHRAKDSISQEKNVIAMIVDGEVDDVKAMLPDEDRVRLERFEVEFWHNFNHEVRRIQFLLDEYKASSIDRRDFAINRAPAIHSGRRQIIFACWDGDKNVRDCLLDMLKKKCNTQTQIDSVRWVFGEMTFWNYGATDA
jgi:RNA ligase